MSELVLLTIDDRSVEVPRGTNLVDAARQVDIEIPVFCHHPRLKPVGMCRMCLVEVGWPAAEPSGGVAGETGQEPVIHWARNLVTACTTEVTTGMVVRTQTSRVADARRAMLEFLLSSHPLDCPVCDKGGECPLQNLTLRYGPTRSRFAWSDKQRFVKPIPLGRHILLDRERCILCGRCVRFQAEVAGEPVLGFADRGRAMEIISLSQPPFASRFSGNTTDICPVGALTTRDFRFAARVWEVVPRPGICGLCAVGCNVMYDERAGTIVRVMPRRNELVNELWICDRGRFAYRESQGAERLARPLVRRDGQLVPVAWSDALNLVAARLRQVITEHGARAVGGIAAPSLSNEDLYAFGRFLRSVVGTNHVDHLSSVVNDDTVVRWAACVDLVHPPAGTVVLTVGLDAYEEAPILYLWLRRAACNGVPLLRIGHDTQRLDGVAHVVLRCQNGDEAPLLRELTRRLLSDRERKERDVSAPRSAVETRPYRAVKQAGASLPPSEPRASADLQRALELILSGQRLVVLYGLAAQQAGLVGPLVDLLTAFDREGRSGSGLFAVGRHANAQGAADMGILPDWLPGYRPVADPRARQALGEIWPAEPPAEPGKSAVAMLAGGLRMLFLLAADPAADAQLARGLDEVEFCVAMDAFLTASVRQADVVLPLQSLVEREGTVTNYARRVQWSGAAMEPVGESRAGWAILGDLARLLGAPDPFACAADVRAEIRRAVPLYEGCTEDQLCSDEGPGPGTVFRPAAPITRARDVDYEGTCYVGGGAGWCWCSALRARPAEAATEEPGAREK